MVVLDVTWGRIARVWGLWMLMSVLMIICAVVAGAIVGVVVGVVGKLVGLPTDLLKTLASFMGGVIGFLLTLIPVKIVLSRKFKEFRVVLIKNDD